MGKSLGYYIVPHPPIIIPNIGKGEDEKINKTKESLIKIAKEIKDLAPKTIIIITPHGPVFRDAVAITNMPFIEGDFKNFRENSLKFNFEIDLYLTQKILECADDMNIPCVSIDEKSCKKYRIEKNIDHGALVPLYFITKEFNAFKLVHITYGMLSKLTLYKFGMAIDKAIESIDNDVVVIASGDLSHKLSYDGPYGYNKCGPEFDEKLIRLIENMDAKGIFTMDSELINEAGECGLRSFYILFGALDKVNAKAELLSYEGPFGVGYSVFKINGEKNEKSRLQDIENAVRNKNRANDVYVRLAKDSLEYYIKNGKYLPVPDYVTQDMLSQKNGVFVSIKKYGQLRGCIGTIFPVCDNVALEIIRNAVQSGTNDPRFYPVEMDELEDLQYSVDVLMPPEKASKDMLDPKKYGVIVRKGFKTGVLLPDLEGVDTVYEQLKIALNKAGISEDESYSIERFEVIRHR